MYESHLSTIKFSFDSKSHITPFGYKKDIQDQEKKTYSNFNQKFLFPNAPIWIKVLFNDVIACRLNKPFPHRKQMQKKTRL